MRIGKLRYRILIEERTSEPDGIGGSSVIWSELATVWASLRTQTGTEDETAGAIQSKVRYTWTIRKLDTVKPDMRVTWQGKQMNIVNVIPDGVEYTKLECVEIGDGGA